MVLFVGACFDPGSLAIVTEFVPGGSLRELLCQRNLELSEPAVYSIALDIARGMTFLHQHHLLHRDLKSHNLLLDENRRVRTQGMWCGGMSGCGVVVCEVLRCVVYQCVCVHFWCESCVVVAPHKQLNSSFSQVKVTDFGLAKWLDGDQHAFTGCGTRYSYDTALWCHVDVVHLTTPPHPTPSHLTIPQRLGCA